MEGSSRKKESCPQLLDLIHKEREWLRKGGGDGGDAEQEEKKLELRLGLGPPGEDWFINNNKEERDESCLSLKHFSSKTHSSNFLSSPWYSSSPSTPYMKAHQGQQQQQQQQHQQANPSYLHYPSVKANESTQTCNTKVVNGGLQHHSSENKSCCQASPASVSANTAVNNTSQKRSAPPVVGWPPVRSFRKNIANSSSSKQASESQSRDAPKEVLPKQETTSKGLFVKINMDGVPIGRKVDLKAYNSYEKLSSAVDELFRGLLAAQKDSSAAGNHNKMEDVKEITGLLDGSGEYTLVYQDNEGDRMLVGDVPWEMFPSTVRRLRVLKSSELSALRLVGSGKQEKTPIDPARR